jgi:hypothetical protein
MNASREQLARARQRDLLEVGARERRARDVAVTAARGRHRAVPVPGSARRAWRRTATCLTDAVLRARGRRTRDAGAGW